MQATGLANGRTIADVQKHISAGLCRITAEDLITCQSLDAAMRRELGGLRGLVAATCEGLKLANKVTEKRRLWFRRCRWSRALLDSFAGAEGGTVVLTNFTRVFGDLDSSSWEVESDDGEVEVLLCVKTRICPTGEVGVTSFACARELLLPPATAFKVSLIQRGVPLVSGGIGRAVVMLSDATLGGSRPGSRVVGREAGRANLAAALVPAGVVVEGRIVKGPVDRKQQCAMIPAGVTEIAADAFNFCGNLQEVCCAPNGIERIEVRAFQRCPKLRDVRLPHGLKYVGRLAFNLCGALVSFFIPASVAEIGGGAFSYAANLEKITIEEGSRLQVIGGHCFQFSGLRSMQLPASVVEVGDCAFQGCRGLTAVYFARGSELRKLGLRIFSAAPNLQLLGIPMGIDCAVPPDCKIERV